MVSEVERATVDVKPLLEEAKKPRKGRPRREVTDEEAYRKVSLKVMRSVNRSLKGIRGMLGGGGRSQECRFGSYFLAIEGQPGAAGFEAEVNRLLAEWTSEGWYPLHVSSQPAIFDAGGGEVRGMSFTVLWGHD